MKKAKPSEMELFEAHRGFSLTIAVVCQIVWLFTQDGPWLPIAIFFCLLGIYWHMKIVSLRKKSKD